MTKLDKGRCGKREKKCYKNREDAIIAASTSLRGNREVGCSMFRPYLCQRCGCWHLTKQEERRKEERGR